MELNATQQLFSIKLKDLSITPFKRRNNTTTFKVKFNKSAQSYVFLDRPYRSADKFNFKSLIKVKDWRNLSNSGGITAVLLIHNQFYIGEMTKPRYNKTNQHLNFKIKTYNPPILYNSTTTKKSLLGNLFFSSSLSEQEELTPKKQGINTLVKSLFFINNVEGKFAYRTNKGHGFLTIKPNANSYALVKASRTNYYPIDIQTLTNPRNWSKIFSSDNPNIAFTTDKTSHILTINRPRLLKSKGIRFKFNIITSSRSKNMFRFRNSNLFIDDGNSNNKFVPMAKNIAMKTFNYYQAAHLFNKYIIAKVRDKFWSSITDSNSDITNATITKYYEEYDTFTVPMDTEITDTQAISESSSMSTLIESQSNFISEILTSEINSFSSQVAESISTSGISSLVEEQISMTSQYLSENSLQVWTTNMFNTYIGQTTRNFLASQWDSITNSFSQSRAFSAVDDSWNELSVEARTNPSNFGLDSTQLLDKLTMDNSTALFTDDTVTAIADTGYTSFGLDSTLSLSTTTDALIDTAAITTGVSTDTILDFLFIGLACFGL